MNLKSIYNLLRYKKYKYRYKLTKHDAISQFEKYLELGKKNICWAEECVYDTVYSLYMGMCIYNLTYNINMCMNVEETLRNTFKLVWMPRLLTREWSRGE